MNNESFKVGEIATIVLTHPDFNWYLNTECEVIGHGPNDRDGYEYEIRCTDGRKLYAAARCLRKRRPPQDWVKLCNLTDLPREVTHV